ncbi:MAG: hydrogenase nickel incorporation protein HypA [Candidatus Hadarchaeum sp.]|uniref:hydrogenase nickel incorporation protein HypA n=1 Tax=Candidatus Hadarchaeum sp. TaxID=2883567 RepID=UPI003D0B36A8
MLAVVKEKGAKSVSEAKVKLGRLQNVDTEIFAHALKELTKGTLLEKAKIKLEPEETRLRCRACGHEWNPSSGEVNEEEAEAIHFVPDLAHAFIRCPRCRSPDFEIIGGRGVWVEYLKISK